MARVAGNEASFAWTGGSINFGAMEGFEWQAQIGERVEDTTPFGYSGVRVESVLQDASGSLGFLVLSGTKSPVPTGTVGDLTLTQKSGASYGPFKALIVSSEQGPSARAGFQRVVYRWQLSAQAAGRPIT